MTFKTSNPYLLAEIDTLEEVMRKDANDLEVTKEICQLRAEVKALREALERFIPSNDYEVINGSGNTMTVNYGGEFEYNEDSEEMGIEVMKLLGESDDN